MGDTTEISWATSSWSPWEGCTKVSPCCDRCYAANMNGWLHKGENWGPGAPRRQYSDEHWKKPLRWNAKAAKTGEQVRVFPSVCDPFDNEVGKGLRQDFFRLIRATPHLTWLLLTKRIGNAERMIEDAICDMEIADDPTYTPWPWPNVWIGSTVGNQEEADRDIPKLLATSARIRFLSIEPILGPVDLVKAGALWAYASDGAIINQVDAHGCLGDEDGPDPTIDLVIVGAESGRGARPAQLEWIRSIVKQCSAAGVAVHVKQLGKEVLDSGMSSPGGHWPSGKRRIPIARVNDDDPPFAVRLDHKKGGDIEEWPEDLRVREMPNG